MKTQDELIAARRADWEELEALLDRAPHLHKLPAPLISRAAALYRAVCADLSRARAAAYTPDLVAFLDTLAARAHNQLYAAPPYRLAAIWELVARDFPRTLRRRARFLACSTALFVFPGILGYVGSVASPAFATHVLPQST